MIDITMHLTIMRMAFFWGFLAKNRGKELERVKGIEPSYSAWKAAALPLSYTRVSTIGLVVGEVGLEPTKA
jgi:hypothetical protein